MVLSKPTVYGPDKTELSWSFLDGALGTQGLSWGPQPGGGTQGDREEATAVEGLRES